MLHLRVWELASVIWRSMVGVVAMAISVLGVLNVLADAGLALPIALELAACVTVGAASYGAVVFALWFACGKPNDAEALVLNAAKDLGSKLLPGGKQQDGRS